MAELNCNIEIIQEMAKQTEFLDGLEISQRLLIEFGAGFPDVETLEIYITDAAIEDINIAFDMFQTLDNSELTTN